MNPIRFTTDALTGAIDLDDASAFERAADAQFGPHPVPVVRTTATAVVDTVAFFGWILACAATVVWALTLQTDNRAFDEPIERFAYGLVLVIPVTIAYFLIAALVLWLMRSGKRQQFSRFRLSQFAAQNGMTYAPKAQLDNGAEVFDLIRGSKPIPVEVGNLHLPAPGSKSGATFYALGYVAVRLPAPMPHIVLDSTRNDVALSLGAGLAQHQRLSLEGDFDRHFRLFCAPGFERDALYLFTPDVMASFIDGAATLEAEFRDDVLILSSQEQLSALLPERWALVSRALDAALPQFRSWERWRSSDSDRMVRTVPEARSSPPDRLDSQAPLISRRVAELQTTPLQRRVPLWVRFVQFGGAAYGLSLVVLMLLLD